MSALPLATPPDSICLLRLSAIGDVTHMLPVVATLRAAWPDTALTWIVGKVEYQLLRSLPDIEFIVFDKQAGLAGWRALRRQLAGRRFDVLLMMQVALRTNLMSLLISAELRVGYDRERSRDGQRWFCRERIDGPPRVHVLDTFFQFIERLGIEQRQMDWLLKADTDARAFAEEVAGGEAVVTINPCSSARANNYRNWPDERYAQIVDYVAGKGFRVLLTGGPALAEREFAGRIVEQCRAPVVDLVGKTSLAQLLALLERSRCLLAPDTGPAHMGTVAGIPVIGLYASSNPARSGPYNSLGSTANAYPEALLRFAGKSVDTAGWGERIRDPEVMRLIGVDAVIEKLDALLD